MPQPVPPVPMASEQDDEVYSPEWQQLFIEMRKLINAPVFYAKPTDPTTTDVANGTWSIWRNTTSGQVRLWANDNGVMRSVQLV